MNSCDRILVHLSLIPDVGPVVIHQVIEAVGAERLPQLYSFTIRCFMQLGFSDRLAARLVHGLADTVLLDKELDLADKHSIALITCLNEAYPEQLAQIYAPPALLYVQGAAAATYKQSIAIVGSRKANSYASDVVGMIVPDFVRRDWAIISGGALGVDTFAHQATVKHGGRTVAVLGSGLLRPYPYSNKKLFAAMLENGGSLMSIFPLLMEPLPGNFPARNRIISGMARGCIVVQAAQKSGAQITAHFALEQGREVFAVPGRINDPLSAGCHQLIAQGATLMQSADDVLQQFGEIVAPKNKEVVLKVAAPKPGKETSPLQHLPAIQQTLMNLCQRPATLDDLADSSGLSLQEVQTNLFDLQLEQLVKQHFTGLWQVT